MNIKGWSIVALILALASAGAYYAGQRSGHVDERRHALQDARKYLTDSLKAAKRATAVAHVGVEAATRERVTAHAATVQAVGIDARARSRRDTLRRAAAPIVDGSNGSTATPSLVQLTQLVRVDDSVLVKDSLALAASKRETVKAVAEGDSLRHELTSVRLEKGFLEKLDRNGQQELAITKPERCGRRCGFVAGATLALAATHPDQVVKAVGWVVRAVRLR